MKLIVDILVLLLRLIGIFFMTIIKWILPTKYKSVKDEVCLVTGAGSGIGRLMALEFSKRGATLVLWDVNEKGNEETAELIKRNGGKAYHFKCDVSNRDEVYQVAEKTRSTVGDVSILVNNAGIVFGKTFESTSDREIERTINVNSLSHFWTVKAFLPHMKTARRGHIVTVASVLGLFAAPGLTTYVASKHAAVGFHNGLELDLRKDKKMDGIKTTLVCPYHIDTGMFKGLKVRFPSLLPTLKPEECVQATMHAVLSNQKMVAMPRSMYFLYNCVTWMPEKAVMLLSEFIESDKAMNYFQPNRDYQLESRKNE